MIVFISLILMISNNQNTCSWIYHWTLPTSHKNVVAGQKSLSEIDMPYSWKLFFLNIVFIWGLMNSNMYQKWTKHNSIELRCIPVIICIVQRYPPTLAQHCPEDFFPTYPRWHLTPYLSIIQFWALINLHLTENTLFRHIQHVRLITGCCMYHITYLA